MLKNKNIFIHLLVVVFLLAAGFAAASVSSQSAYACLNSPTGFFTVASDNSNSFVQPNLQASYNSVGTACYSYIRNYSHKKGTITDMKSELYVNGLYQSAYTVDCGTSDCASNQYVDSSSNCTQSYAAWTSYSTGGGFVNDSTFNYHNLCN